MMATCAMETVVTFSVKRRTCSSVKVVPVSATDMTAMASVKTLRKKRVLKIVVSLLQMDLKISGQIKLFLIRNMNLIAHLIYLLDRPRQTWLVNIIAPAM